MSSITLATVKDVPVLILWVCFGICLHSSSVLHRGELFVHPVVSRSSIPHRRQLDHPQHLMMLAYDLTHQGREIVGHRPNVLLGPMTAKVCKMAIRSGAAVRPAEAPG
jgi:hypothetical protein